MHSCSHNVTIHFPSCYCVGFFKCLGIIFSITVRFILYACMRHSKARYDVPTAFQEKIPKEQHEPCNDSLAPPTTPVLLCHIKTKNTPMTIGYTFNEGEGVKEANSRQTMYTGQHILHCCSAKDFAVLGTIFPPDCCLVSKKCVAMKKDT